MSTFITVLLVAMTISLLLFIVFGLMRNVTNIQVSSAFWRNILASVSLPAGILSNLLGMILFSAGTLIRALGHLLMLNQNTAINEMRDWHGWNSISYKDS